MINRGRLAEQLPVLVAVALIIFLGVTVNASAQPDADGRPELAVIVDQSPAGGSFREYDRIERVFRQVFTSRDWPVKIMFERFSANNSSRPLELRIVYHGIREETQIDRVFRASVTVIDHGKKTDLGIVRYRYNPRAFQNGDDVMDETMRGAAELVADKIRPILFPKTEPPVSPKTP